MSFIKSYNSYIPQFSVADNLLHPKGRKNNHAIAYIDEDIITMAYAASSAIMGEIDAVLFATATPVFKDRYHASYLADLLNLPQGIMAFDTGTTNRAGTDAIVLADTLISSGKCRNVLVAAADIRFPQIGKETSMPFGHGAVALLLSKEKGISEIKKASSYSAAIAENFNYKGDQVNYDARFARNEGFKENMKIVLEDITPSETDSLIINSAFVKIVSGMLQKSGFDLQKQIAPDSLVHKHGYLGSAHGLLRLIYAIENTIGISVLVDYNNGSNVITINTNKSPGSITSISSNPTEISSYQDYLALRKQGKFTGKGYKSQEMFSSEMMQNREKQQLIHLEGFECTSCKSVYFMKSARCNHCKNDDFEIKKLARSGIVYSFTSEYYFPSTFPPTNMIVVDLDGGGRITVQQTDDLYQNDQSKLQIGDRVELVLRKMMENDAKPNYFWKCIKKN